MSRLSEIKKATFDVVIIGGGIIGVGIARDAALRGMSVALFEQSDFGSGTTSGSTRLIHGGLRYLEQFDFALVKMDLQERATLLKIAPHLVKPLPFILPFYDANFFERTKFKIGLTIYDAFAGSENLEKHRTLSAEEVHQLEPKLSTKNLNGGALFYDAQVNFPERLCLENLLDAERAGAEIFNYCRVTEAIYEHGKISGVVVSDLLDESQRNIAVRGEIVVNAAGAWFNKVAGALEKKAQNEIRTTKGVHVACPPTLAEHAVIFNSPIDGRVMFVIPWNNFTWIGTTDTDFEGDPQDVRATKKDVDYLIESAASIIPEIKDAKIYFANAGVRALVREPGSESSVSRMHKIETAINHRINGLINVLGGKITGYRQIAEEVTDILARDLNVRDICWTASRALPETEIETDLKAQIKRAVRREHCVKLNDFIFRRSFLGFTEDQGQSKVEEIADLLAAELSWTAERRASEIENYKAKIKFTNSFRDE
jgi:glycerol-3-phosphate dehydrogenase